MREERGEKKKEKEARLANCQNTIPEGEEEEKAFQGRRKKIVRTSIKPSSSLPPIMGRGREKKASPKRKKRQNKKTNSFTVFYPCSPGKRKRREGDL